MNSYVRVRAVGRENIPESGPFILAPNHASHLDSPAVLTAVGGKRRVWIAGAEDYFFNNALKRLVFGRLLDTIPFDRRADGILGLRRCAEALARGDGLLLFPEGTRSTNGLLQPFKTGVALLALARQAPIIPVYIDRAYDLWPKGQRFARPGRITVVFGKPIPPPASDDADTHETLLALTRRVQEAVTALAGGVSGE
ncbi:MAG: 1-acyl-sn-glycerol-3-phosphate acyltransferase [Planctomycetota bacterium]|nr:MAG: 1-acyl-sn-glycerol-3-phosphate acyltransferase [Planctomycetota bacterium]